MNQNKAMWIQWTSVELQHILGAKNRFFIGSNYVINCQKQRCVVTRFYSKKIKIKEHDAWGKGCLIFAPIHKSRIVYGLNYRLISMLVFDTPINKFTVTEKAEWSKEKVNKIVIRGVKSWLKLFPYDDMDKQSYDVIKFILSCCEKEYHQLYFLLKKNFPKLNKISLSGILRKAEVAELVDYKFVGVKRVCCWIVTDKCFPNFSNY
jgi:hypothetical protein